MKKIRVTVCAAAILLLTAFLFLRVWYQNGQPVQVSDIVFEIQTDTQSLRLKLWHNYYDGKEYLFLPSFCGAETKGTVIARTGWQKSWDGKNLGRAGHLQAFMDGEHQLGLGDTQFTVVVMRSSHVPALFITTASGTLAQIEAEKGNGEPGFYSMITADGEKTGEGQLKELRSRGNATFLEDKKPYQMSLKEAEDLLGTGELQNYILLANRQDRSLLRDKIMYDMAADMELAYSPVSQHVDLYINDEYRGSYQLSEKVEAAENRLPIDVSGKGEQPGFLLSLEYQTEDRLTADEYYFLTENAQAVVIKRPKKPSEEVQRYIQNVFQNMETQIRAGDLTKSNIDAESFAKKYLIEEIGKNLDAMYTSQYFYKDADDATIYAGPVWDYDKTLGNPLIEHTRPVNYQEPKGIYAATKQKNASWWYDLYQIPEFRELVIGEYRENARPAIQRMLEERIDAYCAEIWDSAYMDYMRWDTFENFKYEEDVAFETEYQAEIDGLKVFLQQREQFLTDIWLENRAYHQITCDPDGGVMYVTELDAVEGRMIGEPRDPKKEGYDFVGWIREDTQENYDFTEPYDGSPFTLKAVYEKTGEK